MLSHLINLSLPQSVVSSTGYFITCGLYYKHIMIINYDSSVLNKFGASLTDDARVIIYDRHLFMAQATGHFPQPNISLTGHLINLPFNCHILSQASCFINSTFYLHIISLKHHFINSTFLNRATQFATLLFTKLRMP